MPGCPPWGLTWKQQHLLPAYTGCWEVPLQMRQTSLTTGPQGGMMAEVSPSHLLPWSHRSCPMRSHHLEPAGPSNCVFLSSAGRGIG